MFTEDELLPLSALQHLVFCERQCALIHIERQWQDNPLTLEGSRLHARADETAPRREIRGDQVILRGLALRSQRLGLVGRADVVELTRADRGDSVAVGTPVAVPIPGLRGRWIPFPVEYKRGKPKTGRCDEVQLCAQALCVEETLGGQVPSGALFYGRRRRRQPVEFDGRLRSLTETAAARLHELYSRGRTPHAEYGPKCRSCSLLDVCLPRSMGGSRSARRYLAEEVEAATRERSEPER